MGTFSGKAGKQPDREVIVVGSGPNGLAAAVEMATAGYRVTVIEAGETIGGGTRTAQLTLPGYLHDICSAVHPLGAGSPFFNSLPLARHGLHWIYPPASLAHPFDDGTAALLERGILQTAETLDFPDRRPYMQLMTPLKDEWELLSADLLAPLSFPLHPALMTRFGLHALRSAVSLAGRMFRGERARALFAGTAAHSFMPLDKPATAAFGLILGALGHVTGWPVAAGGSGRISDAMGRHFRSLGGRIVTGSTVRTVDELPADALVFLDVTPRQLLQMAGHRFGSAYRRDLEKYRYGPGVFKIDWALATPIPWRAPECLRGGTVHLGGTMEEIAAGEKEVWQNGHPERPFVILAQQSLFDTLRAPHGGHVGWAYCHVPNGSTVDMTERIERQVERFAPGFRETILARRVTNTTELEAYNANCIGGDINGGLQNLRQMFVRPIIGSRPYATPDKRIYLCSASTPPGGGVHGMCGFRAARCALENEAVAG